MRGIDHVNLAVDDLGESLAFYRDVLDLPVHREPEDFDGEHVMFTVGETILTLMATGRADHWDPADLDHPLDTAHRAFDAERAEFERLVDELDGQFPMQGPYDWGTHEGFYFLDPSGNMLEVTTTDPPTVDRELLTHDDVE
ncbi:MAG: VOC family protein [Haloarculaceae archaeon]